MFWLPGSPRWYPLLSVKRVFNRPATPLKSALKNASKKDTKDYGQYISDKDADLAEDPEYTEAMAWQANLYAEAVKVLAARIAAAPKDPVTTMIEKID